MKQEYPDGPRVNIPLLIMGQMLPRLFPLDPLGFGVEVARRYGDIAHYKLGPLHVYQLNHPDLIRQVLVEEPENFHKPKLMKRVFGPFAGEGLFTSDGEFWKRQRSLMQPAFHQRHLAAYGDVMVTQALGMTEGFADGQVREIGAEMAKLTLRVVVRTLFGSDLPREAEDIGAPMIAVLDAANRRMNNLLRLPSWVPTRRNIREKRAIARLDAILDSLIRTRRASGEDGEGNDDLLSRLLAAVDAESGAGMSDRQLHDEMMTLFVAGHETTANALTWIWYLLSQNPEAEAKLLEELRGVLGGRAPAMADLPTLPYTEMVVREAIRLYPPAPQFGREPNRDVRIGKYPVPRGSLVFVNAYALQRDERFFAEPERFDPERFAKGWEERIPRYAYLPFWRRSARVYWERFRDDGGSAGSGHGGATVQTVVRARAGYTAGAACDASYERPGADATRETLHCGKVTGTAFTAARFDSTRWSIVAAAQSRDTPEGEAALAELCARYWRPLFSYVRRCGYSTEDAQDLTQAWFARLLDKNSLLVAAALNPEQVYERACAIMLLDRSTARLASEFAAAGKGELFEKLKVFLSGDLSTTHYRDIAVSIQMSEGAVRAAVHRLRDRFRAIVRMEIAQTLANPADPGAIDEELRYLLTVL